MRFRFVFTTLVLMTLARPVTAQQRPLVTEDPETIGAGRLLIEGGIDYAHNQEYPLSGAPTSRAFGNGCGCSLAGIRGAVR